MSARRYSTVPWLTDDDLTAAGVPEMTATRGDDEIAHTLLIRDPFGRGSETTLTIHAFRTGKILMSEGLPVMRLPDVTPTQRNPNRTGEEDQD